MVQARWALTLILLLVALPAQDVGAAPWQARAVGRWASQHTALIDPNEQLGIQLTHFLSKALEREAEQEEAPQESHQAGPVPGESTSTFHTTGVLGNLLSFGHSAASAKIPGCLQALPWCQTQPGVALGSLSLLGCSCCPRDMHSGASRCSPPLTLFSGAFQNSALLGMRQMMGNVPPPAPASQTCPWRP